MVVDTFLFAWELDMLECRLTEMADFVDLFVFVESDTTFQGTPKPLVFEENKSRFRQWENKIVYQTFQPPQTNNPWHREYASREALKGLIAGLPSNAIIIHGDVDEIVSKSVGLELENHINGGETVVLEQNFYSMAVDWLYPEPWYGTVIARKGYVDTMTMLELRNKRLASRVIRGGWHFSWLGGEEFIKMKAASFSHTEDSVQSYIRDMGVRLYTEGYHVLGEKLYPTKVDDSYPKYIKSGKCPSSWLRPKD